MTGSFRFFFLVGRFEQMFRAALQTTDPVRTGEYADVVGLLWASLARTGHFDASVLSVVSTIEHFIDEGIASEETVEVNREIARSIRDTLTADERADVDEMVRCNPAGEAGT